LKYKAYLKSVSGRNKSVSKYKKLNKEEISLNGDGVHFVDEQPKVAQA
jgi:hypothetical protein